MLVTQEQPALQHSNHLCKLRSNEKINNLYLKVEASRKETAHSPLPPLHQRVGGQFATAAEAASGGLFLFGLGRLRPPCRNGSQRPV